MIDTEYEWMALQGPSGRLKPWPPAPTVNPSHGVKNPRSQNRNVERVQLVPYHLECSRCVDECTRSNLKTQTQHHRRTNGFFRDFRCSMTRGYFHRDAANPAVAGLAHRKLPARIRLPLDLRYSPVIAQSPPTGQPVTRLS